MKKDNIPLGIALMLGSVVLFMVLNAAVKALGESYPVNQIVFFRNAIALLPVSIAVLSGPTGARVLRTRRPLGHLWRTVIGLSTMCLIFWAYTLLPLADATALNFTSPIFATALSVPLLGERVGIHRWSAVVFGFIGVVVIVDPGAGMMNMGTIVALVAAFGQAVAVSTIRQLSRTEPSGTIVFYFTFLTTVFSALTLPFSWTPIASWFDFSIFAAAGLSGGIAQLLMTRAYSLAPTPVLSPFNYVSIAIAALVGWLFWAEIPSVHTIVGSCIVIASGLYILYRETVRHVEPKPPTPAA